MPGRFYLDDASGLGAVFGVNPPDQPARRNISPGEEILVWDGVAFQNMRWGIVPVGRVNARGRPVMETIINARSETLFDKSAFEGTGRAIIPVQGWYEWTGAKGRKTVWALSARSGFLFFAAITDVWKAPGGLEVMQVAAVTQEPNADVKPIHHRMGVLLEPEDFAQWLGDDHQAAQAVIRPWPDGRLWVREAGPLET